jgi:hypothetical protein
MGTATSKWLATKRAALGIAAAALLLAGCGGGHKAGSPSGGRAASTSTTNQSPAPAFGWLRPSAPPAGWPVVRISTGAAMAYPPGWARINSDRGTATAALLGPGQRYVGYLNLTPRQGAETLANWGRFRVEHNAEEGDKNVSTVAVATGRRLRGATGSCVQDAYTTATGARYVEIACFVKGRRTSAVVVGAAPPDAWARISPLLERTITSVTA